MTDEDYVGVVFCYELGAYVFVLRPFCCVEFLEVDLGVTWSDYDWLFFRDDCFLFGFGLIGLIWFFAFVIFFPLFDELIFEVSSLFIVELFT